MNSSESGSGPSSIDPRLAAGGGDVDQHDQDLLDWLSTAGVRPPDWSFAISDLDPVGQTRDGYSIPIKVQGEKVVSGVYLFYDRLASKDPLEPFGGGIVPLYVGKALNLWNRMQTHWMRPDSGSWH